MEADIGLIGLAVMGQNLILNMDEKGYTVAVFNRTVSKVDEFLSGNAKDTKVIGCHSIEEFCAKLKRPRRVMLMVKAGDAVDAFIEKVLPHLEEGDIIIDGGNSHYPDTQRRCDYLKEKGLFFIGAGISGGEEGARHGPSIMPGGHEEAWPHVKEIFQNIAAKVGEDEPCCDWVGSGGAGHYVKMVHNGIEYGDIQIICEGYQLLKQGVGLENEELSPIFQNWNEGKLNSYLIEITAQILAYKEKEEYLVDKILDVAGQKGTGKWTAINALELGMPVTLIAEAVFARCLSALKEDREAFSKIFQESDTGAIIMDKAEAIDWIRDALFAAKIISYTQGFMMMREAAKEYNWKINFGSVALMWRGGCIIRSGFLGNIKDAFDNAPDLDNLLKDAFFYQNLEEAAFGLRETVKMGIERHIPLPSLATSLSFFDGLKSARLPANLLQAQRDFFGAHTYERIDKPRGEFFHTNWTGTGGDVSSGSYNA